MTIIEYRLTTCRVWSLGEIFMVLSIVWCAAELIRQWWVS